MVQEEKVEESSFRDSTSQLVWRDGQVFRKVSPETQEVLQAVEASGLYDKLVKEKLLLPMQWSGSYEIRPQQLNFVSYPYEWSFNMLKDAAIVTLQICKEAIQQNFILKDASAYNIQFHKGRPVFIDHGSLSRYEDGQPWRAYEQFCKHFLGPLSLGSLEDTRLLKLSQQYIDGVAIDLASKLLPRKSFINFGVAYHIHLHKHYQQRRNDDAAKKRSIKISKRGLLSVVDNLIETVGGLKRKEEPQHWLRYRQDGSYSQEALENKRRVVGELVEVLNPKTLWDIGTNDGLFCENQRTNNIAIDREEGLIDKIYTESKKKEISNVLPLVVDICNPSPNIGWDNKERKSLIARGPADMVLMLAVCHHLTIAEGIPFDKIAELLQSISRFAIVEWVPQEDEQVRRLMSQKSKEINDYTEEKWRRSFEKDFHILERKQIADSKRVLYIMRKK